MRYHNITKDDMLNGDGLRVVLWVAGCPHGCLECHNKYTWDINGGVEFTADTMQEIMDEVGKDYISGITFSGGDPLHENNVKTVFEIANKIKDEYRDKTIWLYTGFTYEEIVKPEIKNDVAQIRKLILYKADVLVDGKYVAELRDTKLHWRGSSNQRIIDVKKIENAINYYENDIQIDLIELDGDTTSDYAKWVLDKHEKLKVLITVARSQIDPTHGYAE